MAKFGKKNVMSDRLEDYGIILLGESGIGKTTLMYEVCDKLFGYEGYMIFNMGKEDGVSAIDGVHYEDIENWKKFKLVTDDIVANKKTDYPDLKVVVIDTLDQIIDITEPAAIDIWNKQNMGKKDFIPAKTLNASFGGFGHGEDAVISMILNQFWRLKEAGVQVWATGHTKVREILDAYTGGTYTTVSTNMPQKYFSGFKTKCHLVGVAVIDRTIETESTGRKNLVTKKDVTVNKVKEERRKIVFRDDNYSVDSKSRLRHVVDEIPLDADAFIKAVKDAIQASKKSDTQPSKKKVTPKPVEEVEELDLDEDVVIEDVVEETKSYPENLQAEFTKLYKACGDKDLKKEITSVIKENGGRVSLLEEETLQELYDKLA